MAKKSGNSGAWLFLGPEIGEKETAVDDIRKKISKSLNPAGQAAQSITGSPIEETVYYAGDTPTPTIISNLQNGSLFSDLRLFLIKSVETMKKKEDIDLLSAYIASPSEDTFLIMISEETNVARGLEKNIPPANKKIFWELLDSKKYEWVESFFRREGFKITAEGIQTILELVENNTAALRQECSRLTYFLDKSAEITGEAAEKWLSHTREESAFTLFSRIAAGDLSRSLESVRILLAAKETPPAIFAGLASCFRKLLNYLALKEAGVTDEFEYKKIGVSAPGAKRDYGAAGRRYDSYAAEKCLALTAEYDMLLRSALSFPDQILMDQFIYKIFSMSPRGR